MKNPLQAIKDNCVDCMGGEKREVPLCQLMDCPLWPYRLGCRMSSPRYHERVNTAWVSRREQRKEVTAMGKTLADYLPIDEKAGVLTKNLARKGRSEAGQEVVP